MHEDLPTNDPRDTCVEANAPETLQKRPWTPPCILELDTGETAHGSSILIHHDGVVTYS